MIPMPTMPTVPRMSTMPLVRLVPRSPVMPAGTLVPTMTQVALVTTVLMLLVLAHTRTIPPGGMNFNHAKEPRHPKVTGQTPTALQRIDVGQGFRGQLEPAGDADFA